MMAFRSVVSSRIPMVIILGATGTGKTKLGVELAQRYETEVISADSMQIYKGLDVVTAKASPQERELVRHHLLDILEPHQYFTVVDFRNRSLKIIDNLIEQGKIPIIVGGTNYYIESIVYNILVENIDDNESLLWDKSRRKRDITDRDKIDEPDDKKHTTVKSKSCEEVETSVAKEENKIKIHEEKKNEDPAISRAKEYYKIITSDMDTAKEKLKQNFDNEKSFTNEQIHGMLKSIDPVMATQLHPNNRRKVLRAIEVWLKTGRRHSEILVEQKQSEGKLRRPGNTIILWLKCEQSIHDERLNARVDSMLEEGLIDELLDFHARHNKHRMEEGRSPDYTKGVFQTLGFKEFHEYMMLPEEQKATEEGKKLLEQSIENMKMATRRYARRQNKMVRGRFLEHPNREIPPIWELDTTCISEWEEQVKNKAITIIESFLNGSPCPYEPILPASNEKKLIDSKSCNYCDICERLIIGDKEYAIHLKSNRHMKVMKKKRMGEKTRPKEEKT